MTNDTTTNELLADAERPMSTEDYEAILFDIEQQAAWRATADKEMDYADGNQLDSELLRRQQSLGIPPAVEDNIGPALLSLQGYEARTRTDWRVTPNGQAAGQEVAAAINFRLNEAERQSKADKAMSEAFRSMIACGIGWVEVTRDSDPFGYPYRCRMVHRNEIHWDMTTTDPDKWSFLRRQQWTRPERLARMFPAHAELIAQVSKAGPSWHDTLANLDGGASTGLQNAWNTARAWTWDENRWYNLTSREVCVAEVWYRRWSDVMVLNLPDGRVVEFDDRNPAHLVAASLARSQLRAAVVPRVRRAFWLGPYLLLDGPTPFPHRSFPYVPFIAFQEDMTGIPYGYVRGMKYAQDAINSGASKLRWGMSVVRVERTKGAVDMTDEQLRRQIARPDADVVLNAEHFRNNPGARFEVKRDYTLSEQHFRLLDDSRATIERTSAITSGFIGRQGSARSGVQEQTQVEQSNQSIADVMDHFKSARQQVGEQLMALVVEDIGEEETTVVIEGDALREDRTVVLNRIEKDAAGYTYLSNDLQRTRLLVSLEDVPSTSSFRGQQLSSMSEAVKSLPAQYQAAAMPFLASLMDVPFKRELVEALRAAGQQASPEEVEKQIQERVAQEIKLAGHDLKARELDMKERLTDAQIEKLMADAVQVGVQAAFAAMQGGAQVAQMPMIAPIADAIMQGAGYRRPSPGGDDPNFPMPTQTAAMNIKSPYIQGQDQAQPAAVAQEEAAAAAAPVRENTSPTFPPRPADGASGMDGIETARTNDNVPA
ncbi:MAG: hypothetical protein V4645_09955 [Pseudomonadota bacterium]